ncbi:transmembrane protein 170A [Sitodiplosis mosellana]|uniref:transmembrane protein 170A n=1 Tax=Sitodiplosis mosellana TaxID=263140 RepID=UPI002443C299|nr:transmembrane protein 170A [Sitodiplosis mosellana]XP_055317542.1 transmembrane protein 170A [Sitodiplosis mosellana]XP_055317543.1 transmembrane protein 170A [Sitodiplosis mosellana]
MLTEERTSKLDTWTDVVNLRSNHILETFLPMWYHIALWSLISSIFIHTCAALIAFVTLRKHKFGRFFSILILVMGVVSPATSGIVSSATIAFVHRASSLQMSPVYALVWGIGLTIVSAFVGYLRILATL